MESKWIKRSLIGTAIAASLVGSFALGEQVVMQNARIEITRATTQQLVKDNLRRWKQIRRQCFTLVVSNPLKTSVNCNDWADGKLREELKNDPSR